MTSHGTRSEYQAGCRCDPCRKANADYRSIHYDASDRSFKAQATIRAVKQAAKEQKKPPGRWMDRAACAGHPTDLWFAHRGDMESVRVAVAICAGCPVRLPCLDYAQTEPIEADGIWGGYTPRQRKDLRRRIV